MRKIILRLICAALLPFAVIRVQALDPNQPPGSNFNLSNWYLQLPTSNGVLTGTAGTVDSISTARLVAGFTNAYFYTEADGAMTFWAPDDGATTSGSTHPRSELREEISPGDTAKNWTVNGTHILNAQLKVLQVSSDSGEVCIGQIHENGGAGIPLVFIAYANKKIHADIWTNGENNSSSVTYQYGSGGLGSNITYQIQVVDGLVKVAINGITNTVNVLQSDPNWATNQIYFKAGDYNQTSDTCDCSIDGALVAFYSLTRYHAPSITNQPASTNVTAGQNATFNVAANGSGALGFQWWFNVTNKLTGATNTSLTVTNAQSPSAGNYTVAVSDDAGSITSAVAVLTIDIPAPPVVSSVTMSADRSFFAVAGTGAVNQAYVLLTTSSLAPPVTWTPVATNDTDSNGVFSFTDAQVTNFAQRFYRVGIP